MVREVTVTRQCVDFERQTCLYPFPGGFHNSAAQKSLSILGKDALREISEYLQTRKGFDSETIEGRVQKSWCSLLSKIQQQDGLPHPEHALDDFKAWVKWLEMY